MKALPLMVMVSPILESEAKAGRRRRPVSGKIVARSGASSKIRAISHAHENGIEHGVVVVLRPLERLGRRLPTIPAISVRQLCDIASGLADAGVAQQSPE